MTAENGRNIGVVEARETPCMKQKEQKSATNGEDIPLQT
jgi:hypothetical protein